MFPIVRALLVVFVSLVTLSPDAAASLRLSELFGDGVVLQRNTVVTIWGWGDPETRVSVQASWNDEPTLARPFPHGFWFAPLPTTDAGGPHTITVSDDRGRRIVIGDVMIGEVWLCSGQSNMVWTIEQSDDTERTLDEAEELGLASSIRVFTVPFAVAARETFTFRSPPAGWRHATRETLRSTSAVAYHLARTLHMEEGVPVGIIVSAVGGTAIEPWMPMEALEALGPLVAPSTLDLVRALDPDPSVRDRNLASWRGDWWQRLDEVPGSSPSSWRESEEMPANSGWTTAHVPMSPMPATVAAHDGIFELRRTVELPADWADRAATLELGPLDDMDDAWVNGVHVGSTHVDGAWATPRTYAIPEGTLRSGTNVIAVRILDTAGPGGATGTPEQYVLRRDDGVTMSIAGEWALRVGPAMASLPPRSEAPTIDQRTPTALHNAMIAPLRLMTLGGICWYQGESNVREPEVYGERLLALAEYWRMGYFWSLYEPDMKRPAILVVQLAPFGWAHDRGHWALIREAQSRILDLPSTGLAVTLDVGDPNDIHPGDKRTVGERLGRLAQVVALGRDLPAHAPRMISHEREGTGIRVRFADMGGALSHVGDGESGQDIVGGVTIAGADRRFVVAEVVIDGDTLLVQSPLVSDPIAVRYAWSAAPSATLFGAEGLPVAPFRTDDWPMPEGGWPPPDRGGRAP